MPAKCNRQVEPRLDVTVHVPVLQPFGGSVFIKTGAAPRPDDRRPTPARLDGRVVAVGIPLDQGHRLTERAVKRFFRISIETFGDKAVVAARVLGTIVKGGFHGARNQAGDRVGASGHLSDEFTKPLAGLAIKAPKRHFAFRPGARLHVVHVVAERYESGIARTTLARLMPMANHSRGLAKPVLAPDDKPRPQPVADAAGVGVNGQFRDRRCLLTVVRRQGCSNPSSS